MFKLFLKIFGKQLGEHLLRANLEVAVDQLDEGDKKYLKKLAREEQIHKIIKKLKVSVVKAGMASHSVRDIERRNDWMEAFDFFLGTVIAHKGVETPKLNPLTNKLIEKTKK